MELAESLKFLTDNRSKLQKLENELEKMTENIDSQDLIDYECKIGEYRNLLALQKAYERDLLKLPLKLFNKMENSNVQEVVTLNRIDEVYFRSIKLRMAFRN